MDSDHRARPRRREVRVDGGEENHVWPVCADGAAEAKDVRGPPAGSGGRARERSAEADRADHRLFGELDVRDAATVDVEDVLRLLVESDQAAERVAGEAPVSAPVRPTRRVYAHP